MNRYGLLCRCILEHPDATQRELASMLEVSLGTVNTLIKECMASSYLVTSPEGNYQLTEAGMTFLEPFRVDAALIIAAGFGSRFVPLTFETPKGLLEVFGERMIERQIKQLHAVGITDITIVVGYLKEKFEYLIDKYGVKLLYNPEYSCKNTLATVYHAKEVLRGRNVYLLSSDNWMRDNMFHTYECFGWYSSVFMDGPTSEWWLLIRREGFQNGVSLLIRRDILPEAVLAAMTVGLCMAPSSSLRRFPNSFCRFWSPTIRLAEPNSFIGSRFIRICWMVKQNTGF